MIKNRKGAGWEMPDLDEWQGEEKFFKFLGFEDNVISDYSTKNCEFAKLEEMKTGRKFAIPHSLVIKGLRAVETEIAKDGIVVGILYKGRKEIPAKSEKHEATSFHDYEVFYGEWEEVTEEPPKVVEEVGAVITPETEKEATTEIKEESPKGRAAKLPGKEPWE